MLEKSQRENIDQNTVILNLEKVWTYVQTGDPHVSEIIDKRLCVMVPERHFSMKYKMGLWDGTRHFFDTVRFLTGFTNMVIDELKKHGYIVEVCDETNIRPTPVEVDDVELNGIDKDRFREVQLPLLQNMLRLGRGSLRLATGGGKTEIMAGVAKVLKDKKVLIVVHRVELLQQTLERLEKRLGEPIGQISSKGVDLQRVTVGMVLTIWNKRQVLRDYLKNQVKVVISDECFSGETQVLVDYDKVVPIRHVVQNPKITEVLSYDLDKKQIVKKRIQRKIKRVSNENRIRIELSDENESALSCTPNHKIYVVGKGYVEAKNLVKGDRVIKYDGVVSPVVLCSYCGKVFKEPNKSDEQKLTQITRFMNASNYTGVPNKVEQMIIDMNISNLDYVGNGQFIFSLIVNGKGQRKCPDFVVRKRNENGKVLKVMKYVEVMDLEHWHKDDWKEIQEAYKQSGKNMLLVDAKRLYTEPELVRGELEAFANNSYVEVKKVRGWGGKWKEKTYVYNLEVEDTHNYFACAKKGKETFVPILVSNCHNSTSSTWSKVLMVTEAKRRWGVSGTPLKKDTVRDMLLIGLTGDVIQGASVVDLVKAGYAVMPHVRLIDTVSMLGRYNLKKKTPFSDVHNHVYNDVRLWGLVRDVLRWHNKKGVLIFTERVAVCEGLTDYLSTQGFKVGSSYGKVVIEERLKVLQQFKKGEIDVLVTTVVLDEGVDVPSVSGIVLVTTNKSVVRLMQRIGRSVRIDEGKDKTFIYDFVIDAPFLKTHILQRLDMYKKEEFITELWKYDGNQFIQSM